MNRNGVLILAMVFAIILSGCAAEETGTVPESKETENISAVEKTEATDKLIEVNRKFSWELFRALNTEDYRQEIFMSPFSVSAMLIMAYNGAEGTTKDAMAEAMHYKGISEDDLNTGYKYLINRLNSMDQKIELEIANSLWYREGFKVRKSFIDICKNYLFSEVKSLDFGNSAAADEINKWIAKKTGNLISSVIDPPIPEDVMLYLINAIYFKGEWREPFDASKTFEADFHAYDGATDKVQMMKKSESFVMAESDEYRAVSLPYGEGKVAMAVILPNGDINEFINDFSKEKWDELLKDFRPAGNVQLQLPKFRMEYGVKELKNVLTSLGMGEIFSEYANFSRIADNLYVDSVLHKAVVDVNEKGTEASAVTVGTVELLSAPKTVSFIVNRPFLFVIYDTEEGNILFIGKKLFGDR